MEKGSFQGYTKFPTDFYSVFHKLFKKLDEEEEMEEDVSVTHNAAPTFGDAHSSREEVYAFYKHWEFCTTLKQFAYVDEYDSRQAPNRRIKRLIEADNNKARAKERSKYNDKMRELIYFLKQKDHRY